MTALARQPRASVLIVEDEALVARDLETTLEDMGYTAQATAASGEDALRQAASRVPDVVLMDIRLQGTMDGVETARILRDSFKVPVIFVTAHVDEQTVARAARAQPYGYVVKPFTPGEVRSAIEIALHKHHVETRSEARERWFSAVLHSIGDAVIACDDDERVSFMNPAAEKLTGWTQLAARGLKVDEVFKLVSAVSGTPVEGPAGRAIRQRSVQGLPPQTMLMAKGSSERRLIDDSAAPIEHEGNLLGAVVVFHDVTEQRRLQEQLVLAEHLASLGTLAAGVAHEINNPLAYNLANVEYALTQLGRQANASADPWLAERARRIVEALSDAREGAHRVADIVGELKKFFRPTEEILAPVDLRACMEWALKVAHNKIRHVARIEKDLQPVPPVKGSDARLSQVFVNLLVNAAEAVSGRPEENLIRIATFVANGMVVAEVHDNGPGIPRDAQRRIFDPFYTTKAAGSGLGLSICHGIVRSLGGDLRVDSDGQRGSTFRVELPATPGESPAPRPRVKQTSTSPATILLVEDEPLLRSAIARMLEPHHRVSAVPGAREALATLREHGPFDLILCDVMMPEVSGIDLYEELMQEQPTQAARMAFMTGGAFTARADEFLQTVSSPRIEKPFHAQQLLEFVARCITVP